MSGTEKGVAAAGVAAAAVVVVVVVVAEVVAAVVAAQRPLDACGMTLHSLDLIQNHRRAASIRWVGTG